MWPTSGCVPLPRPREPPDRLRRCSSSPVPIAPVGFNLCDRSSDGDDCVGYAASLGVIAPHRGREPGARSATDLAARVPRSGQERRVTRGRRPLTHRGDSPLRECRDEAACPLRHMGKGASARCRVGHHQPVVVRGGRPTRSGSGSRACWAARPVGIARRRPVPRGVGPRCRAADPGGP